MPTFRKRVRFSDLAGERSFEADAVIDSGSSFSQIPEEAARQMGLVPRGSTRLRLANGQVIERPLAEALVALVGTEDRTPTRIVIGEPGSAVLLGAHALDGLTLGVDTRDQRLIPKVMDLLAETAGQRSSMAVAAPLSAKCAVTQR